jgi:hypothetical protein
MTVFSLTFMLSSVFTISNVSEVNVDNILKTYVEFIESSVLNANNAYGVMYLNDEFKSKFYLENINKYEMSSSDNQDDITISQYYIKNHEERDEEVEVEVEVEVEGEQEGEQEGEHEEEDKEEEEGEGETISVYQEFIKYQEHNESSVEEHKEE